MAIRCITYLCFRMLRTNLSNDELTINITNGEYIWLSYSVSNWLGHVQQASKAANQANIPEELITCMNSLFNLHRTEDELQYSSLDFGFSTWKAYPEIYNTLTCIALYHSQGDKLTSIKGMNAGLSAMRQGKEIC